MRNNSKICKARESSSKIGKVAGDAILELEFHYSSPRNGHGCLNDIKGVRRDTCTAIRQLQKVVRMIDETDWPTDAEYEEAWVRRTPHIHVVK